MVDRTARSASAAVRLPRLKDEAGTTGGLAAGAAEGPLPMAVANSWRPHPPRRAGHRPRIGGAGGRQCQIPDPEA